ncbi:uncharacterized protein AMSG_03384 [Thecamonas trahens ATCC 50062]|uniref:Uncharacterized protein n=1 Tax=Thecamonas trahens ATCC 50062 TaxID=461836 RepID=A0A0L0D4B6_THETB|nr:hypothetical protein AMSG_03384 [Thecamonas trahens ATCC 50062]KNC46951.1 hypothetical protein AMSG_03384 [Thecamonas trahens ATCC 50062]|eukprot:XP_013760222.1 hypothetical protein AMSG_03384 [Thecamonas trahens ATCC 50062]
MADQVTERKAAVSNTALHHDADTHYRGGKSRKGGLSRDEQRKKKAMIHRSANRFVSEKEKAAAKRKRATIISYTRSLEKDARADKRRKNDPVAAKSRSFYDAYFNGEIDDDDGAGAGPSRGKTAGKSNNSGASADNTAADDDKALRKRLRELREKRAARAEEYKRRKAPGTRRRTDPYRKARLEYEAKLQEEKIAKDAALAAAKVRAEARTAALAKRSARAKRFRRTTKSGQPFVADMITGIMAKLDPTGKYAPPSSSAPTRRLPNPDDLSSSSYEDSDDDDGDDDDDDDDASASSSSA